MDRDARKPAFQFFYVKFKPACLATKTSEKIEISLRESLDMILYNKGITKD